MADGSGPALATPTAVPTTRNDAATTDRFGAGEALDAGVRAFAEDAYGHPLGDVTVHTGPDTARWVGEHGARAVTVGRRIAMDRSRYRPGTLAGDVLLAHELAHVAQQDVAQQDIGPVATGAAIPQEPTTSTDHRDADEHDADRAAVAAIVRSGRHRTTVAAAGITDPGTVAAIRPRRHGALRLQRCSADLPEHTRSTSGAAPTTLAPTAALARRESVDVGGIPMRGIGHTDAHLVIDADGDQSAELDLQFHGRDLDENREPGRVEVEGRHLGNTTDSTPTAPQTVSFDTTGQRFERSLQPRYTDRTDGRSPTRIQLTAGSWGTTTGLEIAPPPPGGPIADYAITANTLDRPASDRVVRSELQHLRLDRDPTSVNPVFVRGTTGRAGAVSYVDVAVGRYGDPFRFTFTRSDPTSPTVRMGISPMVDGVPAGADVVQVPSTGPLAVSVVATESPTIDIDLNGDGRSDLRVWELLIPRGQGMTSWSVHDPAHHRELVLTVTSPDGSREYGRPVLRRVVDGRMEAQTTSIEHELEAVSAAATPEGMAAAAATPDLAADAAATRAALDRIRRSAVDDRLVSTAAARAYDAMLTAVQSAATATGADVTPRMVAAAAVVDAFDRVWTTETAAGVTVTELRSPSAPGDYADRTSEISENPFTGWSQLTTPDYEAPARATVAAQIATALRLGQRDVALRLTADLTARVDRWVARTLTTAGRADDGNRARALAELGVQLDRLADKPVVRVAALFHAAPDYVAGGVVSSVPLHMYYWREGSTWYVQDVTHPELTDRLAPLPHPAGTETVPPHALFAKLDHAKRYPRGFIQYQLPGEDGRAGTVATTEPWSLTQVLSWVATGLAVAALVVGALAVSGGTAATVVVPMLWGLSAAAGAASAVAAMVDDADHGRLTAGSIALNGAQLIASLAGGFIGGIRALTAIRVAGAGSVVAAARLEQATAGTLRALLVVSAGADLVQVVMMGEELAAQLAAIERSGLTGGARARAILLAVGSFGLGAGLSFVSFRANVGEARRALTAGRLVVGVAGETIVPGLHPAAAYHAELDRRLGAAAAPGERGGARSVLAEERIRIVPPEEIGSSLGLARIEARGDRFVIVVVDGAHPSVLAAEIDHLEQLALTRRPAAGLTAAEREVREHATTLLHAQTNWASLDGAGRLRAHRAQVALEIDGQQRALARLEQGLDGDAPLTLTGDDVGRIFDDLENLHTRQAQLAAAETRVRARTPLADVDPQLDEVASLFAKRTVRRPPEPPAWRDQTEAQYLRTYKAAYPETGLTDHQIRLKHRAGQRFNPRTGGSPIPDLDAQLAYESRYATRTAATTATDTAATRTRLSRAEQTELDALLRDRDLARARRDRHRSGRTPNEGLAATAMGEVTEASRLIGEAAARRWVLSRYPGPPPARMIYPPSGAGSIRGDFDQVWRCSETSGGVTREVLVVVEAKGGVSPLGASQTRVGRAEQGSLPYFESTLGQMIGRGGTGETAATAVREARAAADPTRTVRYVHVQADIVNVPGPRGGPSRSTAGDVTVQEFDLSAAVRSGSASTGTR